MTLYNVRVSMHATIYTSFQLQLFTCRFEPSTKPVRPDWFSVSVLHEGVLGKWSMQLFKLSRMSVGVNVCFWSHEILCAEPQDCLYLCYTFQTNNRSIICPGCRWVLCLRVALLSRMFSPRRVGEILDAFKDYNLDEVFLMHAAHTTETM